MHGKVKWYSIGKGYGFIAADDGVDYFVHATAIETSPGLATLDAGDPVEFDIQVDPRRGRTRATNLRRQ